MSQRIVEKLTKIEREILLPPRAGQGIFDENLLIYDGRRRRKISFIKIKFILHDGAFR